MVSKIPPPPTEAWATLFLADGKWWRSDMGSREEAEEHVHYYAERQHARVVHLRIEPVPSRPRRGKRGGE